MGAGVGEGTLGETEGHSIEEPIKEDSFMDNLRHYNTVLKESKAKLGKEGVATELNKYLEELKQHPGSNDYEIFIEKNTICARIINLEEYVKGRVEELNKAQEGIAFGVSFGYKMAETNNKSYVVIHAIPGAGPIEDAEWNHAWASATSDKGITFIKDGQKPGPAVGISSRNSIFYAMSYDNAEEVTTKLDALENVVSSYSNVRVKYKSGAKKKVPKVDKFLLRTLFGQKEVHMTIEEIIASEIKII